MSTKLRKFALLVGAALALAAFSAPAASAATEVSDYIVTGAPCPEIQPPVKPGAEALTFLKSSGHAYESGGCAVELHGIGSVASWPFGGSNVCPWTMDVRVGPDGWGYVNDVEYENKNCSYYSTEECPGDRIVAPAEYNPDPFKNGKGLFKYKNGATDLNVALCSALPTLGKFWGFVSFDLGSEEESPQKWTNQQTAAAHGEWYHHTGHGYNSNIEQNLIITH